ncbi:hypothetical protein AAVH_34153 [Aphelenchoides avenae]|nr:hypothetical protein AAVH_34153 [Aphelenchus avenae]
MSVKAEPSTSSTPPSPSSYSGPSAQIILHSPTCAGALVLAIDGYQNFAETRAKEGKRKSRPQRVLGMSWQLEAYFVFVDGKHVLRIAICLDGMDENYSYNVGALLRVVGELTKETRFLMELNEDVPHFYVNMSLVSPG